MDGRMICMVVGRRRIVPRVSIEISEFFLIFSSSKIWKFSDYRNTEFSRNFTKLYFPKLTEISKNPTFWNRKFAKFLFDFFFFDNWFKMWKTAWENFELQNFFEIIRNLPKNTETLLPEISVSFCKFREILSFGRNPNRPC